MKLFSNFAKFGPKLLVFRLHGAENSFLSLYIVDSAILKDVFRDYNKNFSKPKLLLTLPRDAFDELIKPGKFED